MKKVLILASVASMIDQFNMPNIELLQSMGYEVHVACNFIDGNTCNREKINILKKELREKGILYFQIDFSRDWKDFKAYKKAYQQVNILLKENKYIFLHCHSPIGGVIGRIAAHKKKVRVIYTAHGFHFYKGASIKHWALFYPIERFLARWTDVLITINKEDYKRAKKFHAKKVVYMPGVGVDLEKIEKVQVDKKEKRKELGIPEEAFVMVSVGELSVRKNHKVVIEALGSIQNKTIYYVICGQGVLKENLKKIAEEKGISDRIKLLGFRTDIIEIYKASDIFIFPSLQEGLPLALMEAMASGLPSLVSDIRGNCDLTKDGAGMCFSLKNQESLINGIKVMSKKCKDIGWKKETLKKIKLVLEDKQKKSVLQKTKEIYEAMEQE